MTVEHPRGPGKALRPNVHLPSPPRLSGRHASAAVIGVLTLILGFAIVVQVRAHSSQDSLTGLRESDLIGILDDQNDRADRLRTQINDLQNRLAQLRDSGNRSAAARAEARRESAALGVLLGTVPATGPGVTVTVTDPSAKLGGEDLLDVVEELRGAGAEAIQFGSVRVSTPTAFTGSGGRIQVDGVALSPPYRVTAIGDPKTLDTALQIPGGVGATVRAGGGELTVVEHSRVVVSAVRVPGAPRYAVPTH